MRVIWSGPALRDLRRHTRYIADFNPLAAARMADELLAAAKVPFRLMLGQITRIELIA